MTIDGCDGVVPFAHGHSFAGDRRSRGAGGRSIGTATDWGGGTCDNGPAAEPATVTYRRGTVSVARTSEPGTSGSQFFISYADNKLEGLYTPLGTVTRGLDIIDKVAAAGVADGSAEGTPKLHLVLQKVTVVYH